MEQLHGQIGIPFIKCNFVFKSGNTEDFARPGQLISQVANRGGL